MGGLSASRAPVPSELRGRFVPRTWILDEVIDWLDANRERLFLLTGDPGTGKSVLSAWLVDRAIRDEAESPALERVRQGWSVAYFCSERYVGSSVDPRAFIRDVANQLQSTLPGFAKALAGARRPLLEGTAIVHGAASGDVAGVHIGQMVIQGKTVEETFEQALETPLQSVMAQPAQPVLLLVDGLDEALGEASPTIIDLVARLARIPGPVRILVTCQNDRAVTDVLTGPDGIPARRLDLSSDDAAARVDADIERFIDDRVAGLPASRRRQVCDAARGNFLYAQGLLDDSGVPGTSPPADAGPLPRSLAERYDRQLQRLLERNFGEGWRDAWATSASRFFGLLAIARGPVPEQTLAAWLGEPPERVRMTADRFQQLLTEHGGALALHHPAFATFLLPSGRNSERFDIDPRAAHARIVEHYRGVVTEGRGWTASDDYGLRYVADHLAGSIAPGTDPATARGEVAPVLELIARPDLARELARRVEDPISVGRPFRKMALLLLDLELLSELEQLIARVVEVPEPAIRATTLDALLAYADRHAAPARKLICRMAVDRARPVRLAALRAARRLPRAEQVVVYESVVRRGDPEARKDAAYAVYLAWSTVPTNLTGGVLADLGDKVSLLRPWRVKALLEFLSSATITNYINNCGDPRVAELTSDLWRRVLIDRLHVSVFNRPFLERTVIAPAMARHLADRVLAGVLDFDRLSHGKLVEPFSDEAESARRVIARLDPAVELGPAEDDLARLLESDAVALRILAGQVLAVHAMADFDATQPTFDHLFSLPSARTRTATLLSLTVILPDAPPRWRAALETMTTRLLDADPDLSATLEDPLLVDFDCLLVPLGLAYGREGSHLRLHEQLIASPASSAAVRRAALRGAAVTGIYHPSAALATFDAAMDADAGFARSPEAGEALALVADPHPDLVDDWLGRQGAEDLRGPVQALSQRDGAHRYVETIGLYTNGVHQAIHYPIMRRALLMRAFDLLLTAGSRREWAREYSRGVLELLREADYTLLEWTR